MRLVQKMSVNGSSGKRKNYMDLSDQGTWMEEVSLRYY